jgi:hypothetical protein
MDKINLTDKERRFLRAMAAARETRQLLAGGSDWDSPDSLIKGGYLPQAAPVAGLHQTAGSLVRKGMLDKSTRSGLVHYQLTTAGAAAATTRPVTLAQPERRLLAALADAEAEQHEPWHTVSALQRLGYLPIGATVREVQKTARSLARRGLMEQSRQFGATVWRVTRTGREKIMDAVVDSKGGGV